MNQIESLEFFNIRAEVKTVAEISYNDISTLITKVLRAIVNPDLPCYEIACYEEWGNYESHSFDLDEGDYDEDDWNDVKKELEKGKWPHYQTKVILDALVEFKYIPPCELLVEVYW